MGWTHEDENPPNRETVRRLDWWGLVLGEGAHWWFSIQVFSLEMWEAPALAALAGVIGTGGLVLARRLRAPVTGSQTFLAKTITVAGVGARNGRIGVAGMLTLVSAAALLSGAWLVVPILWGSAAACVMRQGRLQPGLLLGAVHDVRTYAAHVVPGPDEETDEAELVCIVLAAGEDVPGADGRPGTLWKMRTLQQYRRLHRVLGEIERIPGPAEQGEAPRKDGKTETDN